MRAAVSRQGFTCGLRFVGGWNAASRITGPVFQLLSLRGGLRGPVRGKVQ